MKLTNFSSIVISVSFFLLLDSFNAFTQPINNLVKDVTMAAPNAAALGKYGDYTVGNFTGVPDISIPIYTVQEGPLSLPITLNYHASGIKVAEMASWVGAGWSLSAGGMISRTVQGIPDENTGGYYNDNAATLESRIASSTAAASTDGGTQNGQLLNDIADGKLDGEPDLFSFNVAGYSGKFYFDKGRVAQFIPKQDLVLQVDGNFLGFTLIAPDGTRYIFGRVQNIDGTYSQAYDNTRIGGTYSNNSSWYLLRVTTPDDKYRINLNYTTEQYTYLSPASVKYTAFQGTYNSADYQNNGYQSSDGNHWTIQSDVTGSRLASISSTTDAVSFKASTLRTDLETTASANPASQLDTIVISTSDKCQQYIFSYSYFTDPGVGGVLNFTDKTYINKKLKLDMVQQKSCDLSIVNPPYTFTYNGSFLPYRLSKAIDYWGFYNGATTNKTQRINIPSTTNNGFTIGSSNRESDEASMKLGVLTDITFPTGGKTSFTFEANTAPKQVRTAPNQEFSIKSCGSAISSNCCGQTSISALYTPSQEDYYSGRFTLQVTKPVNPSAQGAALCTSSDNPYGQISAYLNGSLVGSYSYALDPSYSPGAATPLIDLPLSTLNLQVGVQYTMILVANNSYTVSTIYNQPYSSINRVVGGLRVKQILTNDSISSANDIVKTYDYSYPSSPGATSGWLLRSPTYSYNTGAFIVDGACQANSVTTVIHGLQNMTIFNDEPIVPLYTFEGNHIGYSYVRETQSGNGQNTGNGSKLYNFYVAPSINYLNLYPTPPLDPIVSNGQVKDLQIQSASNSTIKETFNQSTTENITYSSGKIRKVFRQTFAPPAGLTGCTPITSNFYTDYQIKTMPYRLAYIEETLDGVKTRTDYTYLPNSAQPLFPLTSSMTNSDGKTTVTTNKYATDLSYASDPTLSKMVQLNIISNPVEMTTTVGGVQTKGNRTVFSLFDNNTGNPTSSITSSFPYPYQFYKYKMTYDLNGNATVFGTNSGWDLEGTITNYDMTRGKPTAVNLRGWENVTNSVATEQYTWETNGLIKTRTFKGFLWQYSYFPNTRLVSQITDKDGQFVTFTYDHLQRLKTSSARGGTVTTSYSYNYKDPAQQNRNWIENTISFSCNNLSFFRAANLTKTVRQYMDGLGRPIQSVALANSPNGYDVISAIDYDNQGREFKKYDPFENTNSTTGSFATVPTNQLYTKLEYEPTPLNRTWRVTPPNWQPTITDYGTNTASEAYDMTGSNLYPANATYRVRTTDPDGRVSKTYTDKKGRKTFTVNVQNNQPGGSYMVYQFDDKDRLKIAFTQRNDWHEWVYYPNLDFKYYYDYNDLVTQKQIPDAANILMQYNKRDQLVLMQDGKQLASNRWLATQYDDYGRPTATGFTPSYYTTLDANGNPYITSQLTATQYSSTSGSDLGKPVRVDNYYGTFLETFLQYDSYGRVSNIYGNNQLYSPSTAGVGFITPTNFSEKTALTYDCSDIVLSKTRTHKQNSSTTHTITETMDYDNALRLKQVRHQVDYLPEQIVSQLDYTVKNQVATKWLGKVGGLSFLQKVDYSYNSVGFLTGINSPAQFLPYSTNALASCTFPSAYSPSTSNLDYNDLFVMDLKYDAPLVANAPTNTTPAAEYSGNISQMTWQVRGREKQSYTFKYDYINRMTEADYADISYGGTISNDKYTEKLTYDIRGNIQTLQRNGYNASNCSWGQIDNLTYQYDPNNQGYNPYNKLYSITDYADVSRGFITQSNGTAYSYDVDGNMTADPNKGITGISYNHLNLPEIITFTGNRTITFLYDGSGNKLRKTVVNSGVTQYTKDYVNGIEYKNNALEAIYHSEGRVTTIDGTLKYEYALKDHLGNTRIMFCDRNYDGIITPNSNAETSELTQENSYYAFGMNMEFGTWENTPSVTDNLHQYNGKELNTDFGLNWNDYGARFYDPATARWNVMDSKSEKYKSWNPYNYAMSNPIKYLDPDGREVVGTDGKPVTYSKDDKGETIWSKNASDDTKKIGNALLKTSRGTNALDKIMKSNTKVDLVLTDKVLPSGVHGITESSRGRNSDGTYKRATITISTAKTNDRFDKASDEEQINAVGSHEEVHLEPDQIKKDDKKINSYEAERKTIDTEYEARLEYIQKYGGDSSFKDSYEKPNPKSKDPYGNPKPSFFGLDNDGNSRTKSRDDEK